MTPLDLNRRLATALGWTNIIETGGALLGTPPEGEPQCRGQAKVPDWTGDWRECGPLIGEHRIDIDHWTTVVQSHIAGELMGRSSCEDGRDEAARGAIVLAVVAKLEASQ